MCSDSAGTDTRSRLIRAAHEILATSGPVGLTVEAIAQAAKVSRATAYRHFADRRKLVIHCALIRMQVLGDRCSGVMAEYAAIADQLEAGYLYLADAIRNEPMIDEVMMLGNDVTFAQVLRPGICPALEPVVIAGQRIGDLRRDVPVGELLDYALEELFVMARWSDRSPLRISHRVRTFILPALFAPSTVDVNRDLNRILTAVDELQSSMRALSTQELPPRDA